MMKAQTGANRDLAERLRTCLEEHGIKADVDLGEHEATLAARSEDNEEPGLTVVAHVTDRTRAPVNFGSEISRVLRPLPTQIAQRPTLEGRSAAGALAPEEGGPSESSDVADQLIKLGELHKSGVLTDTEFESKKKDLLGRL
jgi:hypothetical protein